MKTSIYLLFAATLFFTACNNTTNESQGKPTSAANKALATLLENYYNGRMVLVPLESTQNADTTHNDVLYADFTDSYREKYRQFFSAYLDSIKRFNRADLTEEDGLSYDI